MASLIWIIFTTAVVSRLSLAKPAEPFRAEETCVNKFCPSGTYCDAHDVKCSSPPCRPILLCLPESLNGCATTKCSGDTICVERTVSCIDKICKKRARCVTPGTCEALVCPPSHRCEPQPNPHCVRGIFTISDVKNLAQLANQE